MKRTQERGRLEGCEGRNIDVLRLPMYLVEEIRSVLKACEVDNSGI